MECKRRQDSSTRAGKCPAPIKHSLDCILSRLQAALCRALEHAEPYPAVGHGDRQAACWFRGISSNDICVCARQQGNRLCERDPATALSWRWLIEGRRTLNCLKAALCNRG